LISWAERGAEGLSPSEAAHFCVNSNAARFRAWDCSLESLSVIARERSDEAIQAELLKAYVWIGSQGECEAFVRTNLGIVQVHNFVD
jgi:hypothetical protein